MSARRPVTVLVVDDSPGNRRTITQLLETSPEVEVVGRASDGEEGLRQAIALRPDVLTLDLEMPKLDGFAFLRLLMAKTPMPVIVLSSYAHTSDVFKALELGAFDFIPRPSRPGRAELESLRRALLEKVLAVRWIRPKSRRGRRSSGRERAPKPEGPPLIVAIGASTGGPPAVQRLLMSIPPEAAPICLLVCQHMPPRFTRAFADRLDRMGAWSVSEAREGDVAAPGRVFIAPGGRSGLRRVRRDRGHLRDAEGGDRHRRGHAGAPPGRDRSGAPWRSGAPALTPVVPDAIVAPDGTVPGVGGR